jgi:hypothetical protein
MNGPIKASANAWSTPVRAIRRLTGSKPRRHDGQGQSGFERPFNEIWLAFTDVSLVIENIRFNSALPY